MVSDGKTHITLRDNLHMSFNCNDATDVSISITKFNHKPKQHNNTTTKRFCCGNGVSNLLDVYVQDLLSKYNRKDKTFDLIQKTLYTTAEKCGFLETEVTNSKDVAQMNVIHKKRMVVNKIDTSVETVVVGYRTLESSKITSISIESSLIKNKEIKSSFTMCISVGGEDFIDNISSKYFNWLSNTLVKPQQTKEKIDMFDIVMYIGDEYYDEFYKMKIVPGMIGTVIDIYKEGFVEVDLTIGQDNSIQTSFSMSDLRIVK